MKLKNVYRIGVCGECGNLILKDSFLGSITDILKEEGETLDK